MDSVFSLKAESREKFGTGEARALRKLGKVPAVIYGYKKTPLNIAISENEITKHYRKPCFKSTVIELEIEGKKHKILPKELELHPITDVVRHVDFMYLGNTIQKVEVPIVFEGKDRSVGVKRGGVFNIVKRYINLSCDVNKIPKNVVVDVARTSIGQSIKASDIQLPEGSKLIGKANLIIASITGRGDKDESEKAALTAEQASDSAATQPSSTTK